MRKSTLCICENKDADQLCGNREADERLCFRYTDSTIPLLLKSKISSLQPSSVAVQPGLCWTWSETPKTGFLTTRLICCCTYLGHLGLYSLSLESLDGNFCCLAGFKVYKTIACKKKKKTERGTDTIEFLNFWTPTKYTVNTLKFKIWFRHGVIPPNDVNGIANNEDPDQTAPLAAVLIWVCTVCPALSV